MAQHRGAESCWRPAISASCWRRSSRSHLATDPQEPLLAGNWRGAFGHKNVAAGVMAMLLFLGIYIARSGAWISGAVIVGLSSLFLFYAAGKSSLTLCFAVLLLTSLTSVFHSFWMRAILLLTPLLLLNMLSVGAVMSEGLHETCQDAAAGFDLHRPYRHLDLFDAGAAAAAGDRLRLRGLLGQQRHPEPAGRQGMGGVLVAQPQRLSRYRARHGSARTDPAHRRAGDRAVAEFSAGRSRRQWRSVGDGAVAHLAVRNLSLLDGELLSRPRRSDSGFTFLLAVFGLHYLARFRVRA